MAVLYSSISIAINIHKEVLRIYLRHTQAGTQRPQKQAGSAVGCVADIAIGSDRWHWMLQTVVVILCVKQDKEAENEKDVQLENSRRVIESS